MNDSQAGASEMSAAGAGDTAVISPATGWRHAHDIMTKASYNFGVALVAFMVLAFCYEVVARYAFNAPTSWASSLVSYALCLSIFAAMPELTRINAHVAIGVLIDRVSPYRARQLSKLVRFLAAFACVFSAIICLNTCWEEYRDGIETMSVYPLPKWSITIFIPYGLLSSSIYFVRQVFGEEPPAQAAGV
jgi:TRAP-type C4-dicarboxylate transport system permease small subunit